MQVVSENLSNSLTMQTHVAKYCVGVCSQSGVLPLPHHIEEEWN